MKKCPVCLQSLPSDFNKDELSARLSEIQEAAAHAERKNLEADFRKNRLPALLEAERKRVAESSKLKLQGELRALKVRAEKAEREQGRLPALLEAERKRVARSSELKMGRELRAFKQRAEKAERDKHREIEQVKRNADQQAERHARQAAETVARDSEERIEKLNKMREKDHARYEADRARMQSQLDQMSRKLDKQNADQLGKEAEIDLLAELNRTFPSDRIQSVRRGVKGADIIHDIMEDSKVVGRIVFESKNVSGWSNNFISQAKKYQTQYDTPNVIIVSRSFPRKKKGLCIVKNIPVVEPHMAVCLASIMRRASEKSVARGSRMRAEIIRRISFTTTSRAISSLQDSARLPKALIPYATTNRRRGIGTKMPGRTKLPCTIRLIRAVEKLIPKYGPLSGNRDERRSWPLPREASDFMPLNERP